MVSRLYELNLTAAVNEGYRVLDLKVKNRSYTIVPSCVMIQQLAEQIGFTSERAESIRLSVEEMLTDRINNAFEENGEIRIEVLLMPQWLRLRFTDTGRKYSLEAEDASLSAHHPCQCRFLRVRRDGQGRDGILSRLSVRRQL